MIPIKDLQNHEFFKLYFKHHPIDQLRQFILNKISILYLNHYLIKKLLARIF